MKCPYCSGTESRVTDSRSIEEGRVIRRRRECAGCEKRFTTMEKVEVEPIMVLKRDGRREVWDANKVLTGLLRATEKTNVTLDTLRHQVELIEQEIKSLYPSEVTTDQIGDIILQKLRLLDEVAYVRFASVFHKFQDVDSFKEELENMIASRKEKKRSPG